MSTARCLEIVIVAPVRAGGTSAKDALIPTSPRKRGEVKAAPHAIALPGRRGRGKEIAALFFRLVDIVALFLMLLIAGGAGAEAGVTQAILDGVAVEPKTDAALPLGLRF